VKLEIQTFDSGKKKMVKAGIFDDTDLSYTRKVKLEHYMRILKSYGIQEDVIAELQRRNCKTIIMQTKDEKLYSEFHRWIQPNIKVLDYGNGKQRFYPVSKMTNSKVIDVTGD
jgi:hypothetical protein